MVVGLLAVTIAFVLRTGRDQPFQQRRREKKDAKLKAKVEAGKPTESLPLRMLGKGDPKVTFVVGAVLSFPGVSYRDALDHIHKLNPGTVPTVLLVIGFCLMQQILLEVPLLGYVFAPEGTQDRINRFKAWMGRKGRPAATIRSGRDRRNPGREGHHHVDPTAVIGPHDALVGAQLLAGPVDQVLLVGALPVANRRPQGVLDSSHLDDDMWCGPT
ncbi:MAG: GAP family protein [Solirubrobacteraceae bacterium]